MKDLPREYLPFHIGKVTDKNFEKRRILVLETMEALGKVIGREKFELYALMKARFESRKWKFKLPDLEIGASSKISDCINTLFAAGTLTPRTGLGLRCLS
jgi:hypothetical protein